MNSGSRGLVESRLSETVAHGSHAIAETELQLFCPTCGYNVHGLAEDTCPECGNTFDREELIRRRKQGTLADKELLLRFFVPPVVFVTVTAVLAIAISNSRYFDAPRWMVYVYLIAVGIAVIGNAVKLGLAVDLSGRTITAEIDRGRRNYFVVLAVVVVTLLMQAAMAIFLGCGCGALLMMAESHST